MSYLLTKITPKILLILALLFVGFSIQSSVLLAASDDDPKPKEDPGVGSLIGVIDVKESLRPRSSRTRVYSGFRLPSQERKAKTTSRELANVVVYIGTTDPALRHKGLSNPQKELKQENESFVPHILPVLKGTTVHFPNLDPIYHNVFSLSSARSFDLGRYPDPESKSIRFDKTGVVKVFCHLHADMGAVILVLDNPYFAIPDDQGRFVIQDIPAGEYEVVAWHERVRSTSKTVSISSGETTILDFQIPLAQLVSELGAP